MERALAEPGHILARLDALGEAVVRYFGAHPQAARLLTREAVDAGPFLTSPRSAVIGQTIQATARLLAEGVQAGALVLQDPAHLAGSIVGLHMLWYAAQPLATNLLGGDPFTPAQIDARVRAVQAQVRRLCGRWGSQGAGAGASSAPNSTTFQPSGCHSSTCEERG